MVMLVMMLVLFVIVMVASAVGILALLVSVVMMMLVMMLVLLVIVMVASAVGILALLVTVVMVMMMLRLLLETRKLLLDRVTALHSGKKLLAVQLGPGRGDNRCRCVVRTQKCDRLIQLCLCNALGVREHDAACVFDLIVEEFTEILHIHLAFLYVHDRGKAVKHLRIFGNALHRTDNIRKLAHARGLDENAVGCIGIQHLVQRLAEIADERAADATAVHLGNLNSRVLHKSAVNADLTEFVLDEHQLLPRICLGEQLLDERGLTRSQKSRKNIDLSHCFVPSLFKIIFHYTPNTQKSQ